MLSLRKGGKEVGKMSLRKEGKEEVRSWDDVLKKGGEEVFFKKGKEGGGEVVFKKGREDVFKKGRENVYKKGRVGGRKRSGCCL